MRTILNDYMNLQMHFIMSGRLQSWPEASIMTRINCSLFKQNAYYGKWVLSFSRSNVCFYNFLSPMPLLLSSISLLFGSICEFGRSLMGLTVGHFSILLLPTFAQAILYPYDTPSRETKSLDGFWTFKPDPSGIAQQAIRNELNSKHTHI